MKLDRRAVALALIAFVLVVACEAEGRTFQTTLQTGNSKPLPVILIDETELVTGIGQAELDLAWAGTPAVHPIRNDQNAAVLSWLGGVCDGASTVRFHVVHGDYLLNLETHRTGDNCPDAGMPRAIRIAMSRSMPVESIVVAGGNP